MHWEQRTNLNTQQFTTSFAKCLSSTLNVRQSYKVTHSVGIIEDCGVSVEKFFNAMKEAQAQSEENDFYVQVLLSVTDYSNFIDMMKQFKQEAAQ